MRPILCIVFASLFFGCIENAPINSSDHFKVPRTVGQDTLVERLSMHMASQTDSSLLASETNTIIEFCIDHSLDVEWKSNMAVQILDKGQAPALKWGDPVRIHYEGRFLNDVVFDSSIARKDPLQTYVGKFIDAWNEALTWVGIGGELFIICPSSKAYGAEGFRQIVGPNEILMFQLKVLPYPPSTE